jgi:hypothetical protein
VPVQQVSASAELKLNFRFGSLADIAAALPNVRFTRGLLPVLIVGALLR